MVQKRIFTLSCFLIILMGASLQARNYVQLQCKARYLVRVLSFSYLRAAKQDGYKLGKIRFHVLRMTDASGLLEKQGEEHAIQKLGKTLEVEIEYPAATQSREIAPGRLIWLAYEHNKVFTNRWLNRFHKQTIWEYDRDHTLGVPPSLRKKRERAQKD